MLAGHKSFIGPVNVPYALKPMPKAEMAWVKLDGYYEDTWKTVWPLDDLQIDINGATVAEGTRVSMKEEMD